MKLIPRTLDLIQSPIHSAETLLQQFHSDRTLLDLSQGALNYPTAPVVAEHIAEIARGSNGGKYTTRSGLDELRELFAQEISEEYSGTVVPEQTLITAGCNQAFCAAISAIADRGDEVIMPVPYYFNHDMWLRLEHVTPVYLRTGGDFVPHPLTAETLISTRTKAIVLVSPGNPTGATIPSPVISDFAALAVKYDIMLIIDETYRVFRSFDEPAHNLFAQPSWPNNVVSLHSFSKEFAIPGHRVGAAIAHPDLIAEMMKIFDCIAICAPRLGQEAVIAALKGARKWRHERVVEIRERQARFEAIMAERPGGFELCAVGGFFGWVRHPVMGESTDQVVRRLLLDYGVLVLPGTTFSYTDDGFLRFSFANLSPAEIDELGLRLRRFTW